MDGETMIDIGLHSEALALTATESWKHIHGAGGTCVFIGTVRNETKGREVVALEFEAYEPMAITEMKKIAQDAMHKWPLLSVIIHHRVGRLVPGDIPVIISVSSAHRDVAFEACRYCIDTL